MTDALGRANRKASEFVVERAERRRKGLAGRFGSYRKLQGQIRASSASTAAQVRLHGPLANAAEFGAFVHPVFGRFFHQASFFRQVWPFHAGQQGHLIFPTIREHEDEITELYAKAVMEELRAAFPEGGVAA